MPKPIFSQQQKAQAIALVKRRLTYPEVAERMSQVLGKAITAMNINDMVRRTVKTDPTLAAIIEEKKKSEPPPPKKMNEAQEVEAIGLVKQGLTYGEIARIMTERAEVPVTDNQISGLVRRVCKSDTVLAELIANRAATRNGRRVGRW